MIFNIELNLRGLHFPTAELENQFRSRIIEMGENMQKGETEYFSLELLEYLLGMGVKATQIELENGVQNTVAGVNGAVIRVPSGEQTIKLTLIKAP